MFIDRTHRPWALATLVLAVLATVGFYLSPPGMSGGSWQGLLFGGAGTALMVFAGALPLGKKLARWKIVRLPFMQKGHIWLGLLSALLALFHAGFRRGGQIPTALLVVLLAIIITGIAGLYFQHLLSLKGKDGKSKTAATIISVSHRVTLLLHIPLTVSLLVLGVTHAVTALYY